MSGQFSKKTLRDVPLEGKTVLVRTDYNVPLKGGKIGDDYRIQQSLPTLRYLREHNCKVIIISHLGRPKGMVAPALTLEPVAERLGELLNVNVRFVTDCIGDRALQTAKKAAPGDVVLFENVRFHEGDEKNDSEFARQIVEASGADYFVQDGFGVIHRSQASTDAITQFLPSVAGLLIEKEFNTITGAIESPKRPLVAVLGGAKVSDKIKVIERFVKMADKIIIGGAMANTFLDYKGIKIGKSIYEPGLKEVMDRIYSTASEKVGVERVDEFLILPTDVAVAPAIDVSARRSVVSVDEVTDDEYILDIGAHSIQEACAEAAEAGTVVWNGTLGYAEFPQFAHSSARMALTLAQHPEIISVIGGGDTADFVLKWDAKKGGSFTHVSTGGGASLELMSGKTLPGIEALMNK